MVNIVADDKIPFIRGVLEQYANICYLPANEITHQRLTNTDALVIRTRTKCNAQLLAETAVKFIVSATIGYDHIDTDYCEKNGIQWANAAGCNASSVKQYVLAALLWLANKKNFRLQEKTIGIVGVGNVGSKVARMAKMLGMKVLLCDPPRAKKEQQAKFVMLEELVAAADIITIHVSLSQQGADKTYGLFSSRIFSSVKEGTIIINSSRGEVIDERALKTAIQKKQLSDVALDVWQSEPNIDRELLNMVTIATPHIAGYSVDGKAMGTAMSVNALSRFYGWGLDTWFPQSLPTPDNTQLQADFSTATFEHNLHLLVKSTYDIMSDDNRLRTSPNDFERQRGHYPLRREPSSYTVNAANISEQDRQRLAALQFHLT